MAPCARDQPLRGLYRASSYVNRSIVLFSLLTNMPLNLLNTVYKEGTGSIPYWAQIRQYGPYVATLLAVKRYFSGSSNTWERKMHGRVVMVTGGTSGVGEVVARDLAQSGAQVILLVRCAVGDEWLVNLISDMREKSGNGLIYAEQVDLGNFYSIRKFATKWLDNSPPRRLDGIVCCAGVTIPPTVPRRTTFDGLEEQLQVNYLGHYHLLTLLVPALRAQPADRDVRVILTSCVSLTMGNLDITDLDFTRRGYRSSTPWTVHGASKLALTMFGYEYRRRVNDFERSDKQPSKIAVSVVDPGMMRSPSFKRFFSMGSVLGLIVYLLFWPIWWVFLKTSLQGAQSLLFALKNPDIIEQTEASYISECRVRNHPPRKELKNAELMSKLYDVSSEMVLAVEKESVRRIKRQELEQKRAKEKDESKSQTLEKDRHQSDTGPVSQSPSSEESKPKKPSRRNKSKKA